jgi:peptide/nickel transport system permease protein
MTRRNISPALIVGGVITLGFVLAALVSLGWTPASASKMNIANKLKAPFDYGLLGTDHFGRDILSMLMVAAWNSLSIALIAVSIGASIGILIGVIVAAQRGWTETLVMRLCDIIFALPPLLSAMMLGAVIGSGRYTAIIAIAVFMVPVFARMSLGAAKQLWARDFVMAAVALGRGKIAISLVHVLPNISSLIIIQVAIQLGMAVLTEAGLSFLGLGVPPPAPTWGRMLADSQTYLNSAPWMAILPGLAIALFVSGLNLFADGLRDFFDPKTRGTRY